MLGDTQPMRATLTADDARTIARLFLEARNLRLVTFDHDSGRPTLSPGEAIDQTLFKTRAKVTPAVEIAAEALFRAPDAKAALLWASRASGFRRPPPVR